ncbi:MAG: F0F1 ATP synthase subunit A, partial [Proteobacteria bacterium]|nr:F0F1 ATP synthase subunit A [Pseudomonadota bacterium]
IREHGFMVYVKGIVPNGVPLWLWPLMFPIEILGFTTKAFALCIRLFANMIAGHIVISVLLGLILIFGEVTPKCLAQAKARPLARLAAIPTAAASRLLTPVRAIMNVFIHWVFGMLKIPETKITDKVSQADLRAIMSTGEAVALLEEDEREMIHGVFELSDTFAEEIMIPRAEVKALPDTLDQRSMLEHLRQAKHKRIPIYHENLDDLAGFVLVKEVLLSPERPWRDFGETPRCSPVWALRWGWSWQSVC